MQGSFCHTSEKSRRTSKFSPRISGPFGSPTLTNFDSPLPHVTHINKSSHIWMSLVTHEWDKSLCSPRMSRPCGSPTLSYFISPLPHVTNVNESRHTHESVTSHMTESCHYDRLESAGYIVAQRWLTWVSPLTHITHINEPRHIYESVTSHVWRRYLWAPRIRRLCSSPTLTNFISPLKHITHMNESHIWISPHVTHMNESRHKHEWVTSHIHKWVTSHIWKSHVTMVAQDQRA